MNSEIKSGISTIYRVSVILPDITHDYMVMAQSEERRFDREMVAAFAMSTAAGSNFYSEHEEWADFRSFHEAEDARNRAVKVVAEFTALAIKEHGE